MTGWVEVPDGSPFPVTNLPYGVFSTAGQKRRVGVALGEDIVDLAPLAAADGLEIERELGSPTLNPFLAMGRPAWSAVRAWLCDLLATGSRQDLVRSHLVPARGATLHLPFEVADYVDFYSSQHHAENVGRLFRPDDEPVVETRVGVRLTRSVGRLGAGDDVPGTPIVWSLSPEVLSTPVTTKVGFSLTPKLMLVPVEVSVGGTHEREYTQEDNYVVGTGRDEGTAQWFFRRTRSVALEGMHELRLVIRAPAGASTTAEVMVTAKVRRRLAGVLPYRATLPPSLREVRLPT